MRRREFLKLTALGVVSTSFPTLPLHGERTAQKSKPNIIFILSDDQGWNGLSVRMHPDMPNSRSDYYQTLQCGEDRRPAAHAEDRQRGQDEDAQVSSVAFELLRKLLRN